MRAPFPADGFARPSNGQNAASMHIAPRQSGIYRSTRSWHGDGTGEFVGAVLVVLLAALGFLFGVLALLAR